MEWRKVNEFPNYEVSEDGDVRNIKTKHKLKPTPDEQVVLRKDNKNNKRSLSKLYYEVFPELKDTKSKVILTAEDDANVVPKTEPERYEALCKIAAKIVSNGHNEFPSRGRMYQALWNIQAQPHTNRLVFNGMTYEDLIQETILLAYEFIATLDDKSPLPVSYLTAVIRNNFLKKYRDPDALEYSTSLDKVGDDGEAYSLLDVYVPEVEEIDFGISDSIYEKLKWLQSILNRQDYEIIYYYYGYELTMEQIALKVGLTRQTVSNRIKHILSKVQVMLGKAR